MHTEGTILFANPEVYEKRYSYKDRWKWNSVKNILDPNKSEPCSSSLLKIFDPIFNRTRSESISNNEINFIEILTEKPSDIKSTINKYFCEIQKQRFLIIKL